MENLYETILKMDKSERLFFRRGFNNNDLPHYIKIYDLIIKSRTSNTDILNEKIKNLNLGNENYLKHQLLENLLQSIMHCNTNNNEQVYVLNEISIIKTLRFKKQINLAQKKWQRLFDYCKKLEFPGYIEILLQEKLKLELHTNQNFSNESHRLLLNFSNQHANHYIQILQLRIIYQDLIFIRKRSYILTDENKDLFKNTIKKFNAIDPTTTTTSEEFFFIYNTSNALIYFLNKDFNQSINYLSLCLNKIGSPITFLKYNNEFMLDFIKLFSDIAFILEKFELVATIITKIQKIKLVSIFYQEQFELLFFLIQNRYFNSTIKYKELETLYSKNKPKFDIWITNATKEMRTVLVGSISISYFIANNHQEALYYANLVIASYNKSFRQELISFFYLFEILITYEINDAVLFESKVQTANAHFKKYNEHKLIGLEITQRLHKAFNTYRFANKKIILQKLSDDLKIKTTTIQILFTYFNIPMWIDAKINKMKYQDYKKSIFKTSIK